MHEKRASWPVETHLLPFLQGASILRVVAVGLYLVPVLFLAVFFFYPLFEIFKLSFAPQGRLDLSALQKLVGSAYYLKTLWFTIWQATVSTLLTLLLAWPATYVFARYSFPGKSVVQALTTIPFVLPSIVVAAAFTALLGPRGWVNTLLMGWLGLERPPIQLQHTIWMILLAHVFYNYTIILRIVGGFWANLSPRVEEAAAVLGAGRWQVFREITFPLLLPAIAAASLLVFIFDFTSFGVILILGGPRYATLEVEIYRQAMHLLNLPVAAALSLAQILFTLSLMGLYTRLQTRTAVPLALQARRLIQRRPATTRQKVVVGATIVFMLGFLTVPLLALVARSVALGEGRWTLQFYRELFVNREGSILFVPPMVALRNSITFALITTGLAIVLGVLAAYLLVRRQHWINTLLDPLFMLPLGTSAVTLGFGFIIALDEPPLNLRTSPALIPIAHTLVAFPFVVRSVLPALRSIDPRLREAAAVLGASPWRILREIDLPIVGRAILVGAVFAFTVSMGEFGATVFIARPQIPTIPVAIFRFLGQPGMLNYGQALAMSTILMGVVAAGFLAIERLRIAGMGEF